MVKNIKRNAFATGMQDKRDMRPLESPENISEPNTEQESTQAVPETREPSDQSVQTSADMHAQTLTEEEADRRARLITDITHPETSAPSETHQAAEREKNRQQRHRRKLACVEDEKHRIRDEAGCIVECRDGLLLPAGALRPDAHRQVRAEGLGSGILIFG